MADLAVEVGAAADAVPARQRVEEHALLVDLLGRGAARVVDKFGPLRAVALAADHDLLAAGLGQRQVVLLRRALALGVFATAAVEAGPRLGDAVAVGRHFAARLALAPVEEFWCVALDVRHRVIDETMLARGSLTGVEVHPRDVFRHLIRVGAAAVILVHNHPSGEPKPSAEDIELTVRLRNVGDLVGIIVLDHVVVAAGGQYRSAMADGRRLP